MRSFTLAAGFWLSSFARTCGRTPAATRFRRTSGVRPISSQTLFATFMGGLLVRGRSILARRIGVIREPAEQGLEQHGRIAPGRERRADEQVLGRGLELETLGPDAQRPAPAAQPDAARRPPVGRDAVRAERVPLARRRVAERLEDARAEDRPGRADLEGRRARSLARLVLDAEEPAARMDHGDVAREDAVEAVAAGREHAVEDLRLERGDEEARGAAVARPGLAAQQPPAELGVLAAAAVALRAEAIRESAIREHAGAPLRRLARRGVDAPHEDLEAVRLEVARAELVGMARRLEHPRPAQRETERGVRIEARRREPLRRDGDSILAPRIADVARRRAGRARELARDLLRRAQGPPPAQEGVAALPRRRVQGNLVDAELLGPSSDSHRERRRSASAPGAKERRWIGEGPRRRSARRCAAVA